MTNELRARAERCRDCTGKLDFKNAPVEFIQDAWALASAYLAEHPVDDEEPVTEEWLLALGFERNDDDTWPILSSPIGESRLGGPMVRLRFEPLHGCDGWHVGFLDEWSQMIDLPAHGDVRRLCKALGIELKEPKSP